jgi:hypothetical protein
MHEAYVKRVFECQQIAIVSRVDFVEFEHPDANFCFAVVHLLFWIPGVISKHFRERIQSQRESRIVYSDPSYWVVLPYTQKQNVQKKTIRAEASLETTARRQPRFHLTHLHLHHLHLHQQKETRIAFAVAVATNLIVLLKSFTTHLQIQFGKQQRHPMQAPHHHAGTTWKRTFVSTTTTPAAPSPLINK